MFDDVAKKKDVRPEYFGYDRKTTENVSRTQGAAKKRNKCLNYVGGEGERVSGPTFLSLFHCEKPGAI